MVDRDTGQSRNLLYLIREFGPNREKAGGSKIFDGIELMLDGSGIVVPTLEEIMASDGGKTAEILAARKAPVRITRETPEAAEWRIQTDGFLECGLHEALKYQDAEAYRSTIPQFFPKPRSFDGQYDKPLAVEVRIPLPDLHQLIGIKEHIDISKITNGIRIPKKPYTIYIVNSVETVTGTFDFAMGQLAKAAVADTFIEVDMAYLRYPELFQTWLDAGNSRSGAGHVPYLYVNGGRPSVGAHWALDPHRGWRLLSRGKKIGT